MSGESWPAFHRRWSRFKPPLAPNHEVAAAVASAIDGHSGGTLLLGVTPQLCDIAAGIVALDSSADMIAQVWPGDTTSRRAIQGDWLDMPFTRRFAAVIGDGSLNVMSGRDHPRLLAELARVLLPGARLAIRVYLTPQNCETVTALRAETMAGKTGGFHAFKMRLAMAIVAGQGAMDVPVALIHSVFEREFPDRQTLGDAAGWSAEDIAEIDLYAGLPAIYSFPRADEAIAMLPASFVAPHFLASGDYPVAERCPILVADFRP